jgi:hypothetical protein
MPGGLDSWHIDLGELQPILLLMLDSLHASSQILEENTWCDTSPTDDILFGHFLILMEPEHLRKRDLAEERVSEVMEDLEVMEGQTIWYATCKRNCKDLEAMKRTLENDPIIKGADFFLKTSHQVLPKQAATSINHIVSALKSMYPPGYGDEVREDKWEKIHSHCRALTMELMDMEVETYPCGPRSMPEMKTRMKRARVSN